ncbi:hypothetical protein [Actinacidiphila sp. ITFR-21]|uniref:hypothetical protein n=1 Tax=Actinacidiphila sp. ITFR-21 TaxID=3075199 RepID=UPI00288B529F|nr:hypothetical protein [Streptomyces sp. ITFR-21]WNI20239.1 hypothetical protein RLT57_32355 [Streptomyces sp. ITFR-21]
MTTPTRGERLALFAALTATFEALHGLGDHWIQQSRDASGKGAHGTHLVYAADGKPVADDPWRHGKEGRTCTASAYGRACVTRHVASYSGVQLLAAIGVTRAFGVRVPVRALLVGAAINGLTHAVLDRREPLLWLAGRAGKAGYIQHATAVRKPGDAAPELSGPGTALMELDEAAHRAIGVAAALVTTWLATRAAR